MHVNNGALQQMPTAGEFIPYFQPLTTLRTGKLAGFEALARWNLEGEIITPDKFISLAEKHCWIGELTEEILRSAFGAVSSIPGFLESLDLAINISPLQLRPRGLTKTIKEWSQRAGFPLERLVIEITESTLVEDLDQARELALELKELGCRIALDDFGTGYSGLWRLQALPIDMLKIDRRFVRCMTNKQESRKIVAAVLGLGQSLGWVTVAEGVETEEQAEMLLWMGCDLVQGALYGMPQPASEIGRLISAPSRHRVSTGTSNKVSCELTGGLESLPSQRLAHLQAIYDCGPLGLAFLDGNMRFVNLNRILARMHGIPTAEHIGRSMQEIVPGAHLELEPYFQRALKGEAISGVKISRLAGMLNGETSARVSFQPARDAAGEVVGISMAVLQVFANAEEGLPPQIAPYSFMSDPTAHRGKAAMLIQSRASRELIAESLRSLGFLPRHVDDLGTDSATRLAAQYDLLLLDEHGAEAFRITGSSVLTQQQTVLPPIVLFRPAGTAANEADLDFTGVVELPLASKEIAQALRPILHAYRSLTRRYKPLLDTLNIDLTVLESVTNGVTIGDATKPDMPLVYVNPAFEKMTGYGRDEVIGRNCRFLQGLETEQPGLTTLREAICEQRETMTVLRNYRKDGTPFWNELHVSPLKDSNGRLTHFVGIQSDVTMRIEFEQRLTFMAQHDQLTGLANRRLLLDRLRQAILRASRSNLHVAILFFDLNNFKNVNDIFGHDAGDELLRVVAQRLQIEVRACDTVARLGGDEFVVLVPDMQDEYEIPGLLLRIREKIREKIVICGQAFGPSASVGLSLYPRHGQDIEELLKVADMAMYADKHGRRQAEEENLSQALLTGRPR